MRYLLIDEKNGDIFEKAFETKEQAIAAGDREWAGLTAYDKKQRDAFYILESVTDDADAQNRYDGDVIKDYL